MRAITLFLTILLIALVLPAPAALATHPGANGPIVLDGTDAGGITVVGLDGTVTEILDRAAIHLEVSPDGRTALFVGFDPGDIQLISLAGGPTNTVIPREQGGRPDVSWSPDGSRFVVATGPTITSYDSEGLDPQVLFDVDTDPNTSNGYDAVVWTQANEIIGINSFAGIRIDVATGQATYPNFDSDVHYLDDQFGLDSSPDGQQLIISCGERVAGFPNGLCIMDRDLQVVRFLPPSTVPGSTRLLKPAWSPDGNRLAFITLFEGETSQVYTSAVDGSDPQLVADLPADSQFQGNFPGLQSWAPVAATPPQPLEEPPPPPTNNTLEPGGFDADPTTTERADYTDPVLYAVAVSAARFDAGMADYAVVSRDDNFADSLVGTALTGQGPLLYTQTDSLPAPTRGEISRAVGDGGTVYLLGGINAISQAVEDDLATSFSVRRLEGPSRIETSVAVAQEVIDVSGSSDVSDVAVARAFGIEGNPTAAWADSVSVGAWTAREQVPTVVTQTEGIHPAVQAFLGEVAPDRTVLLGGIAALGATVEAGVPNPQRVAGASRAGTAQAIADQLVGEPADDERQAVAINGYRPDGWLFGLPASGLAADTDAALALAQDPLPPETAEQLCDADAIDVLIAGGLGILTPAAVEAIDLAPAC